MDFLLDAITTWLKEMLVGGIMGNLSGMFDSVNQQVADISVQVGQTPQGWNGSIFSMIQTLSNSIIVPIAGVILAAVMTIELIQMIADKNNLHDVDTWMIFKWVFKSAAAILIVTNTWSIVMGVFDMAQSVVAQASGIIGADTSIDISSVMGDLEPRLMDMDLLFSCPSSIWRHPKRPLPAPFPSRSKGMILTASGLSTRRCCKTSWRKETMVLSRPSI